MTNAGLAIGHRAAITSYARLTDAQWHVMCLLRVLGALKVITSYKPHFISVADICDFTNRMENK